MDELSLVAADLTKAHEHDGERDVSLMAIDQYLREVRFTSDVADEQVSVWLEQVRRGLVEQRQAVPSQPHLQVAAAARVAVVARFQRLVCAIARRYQDMGRRCGLDFMDLVAEGQVALLQVVARLDVVVDSDVSAFARRAATYIHGFLRNTLRDAGMIRLPGPRFQQVQQVEQIEQQLAEQRSQEPTAAEVAATIGISVEQWCDIEQWRRCLSVVSLEGLAKEDGEAVNTDEVGWVTLFGGVMKDDGSAQASWLAAFQHAFETALTPRQQLVMRLRYGLGEETTEVLTQGEIAARLGVTNYTTVQYYERRAKAQLQVALASLMEDRKAA